MNTLDIQNFFVEVRSINIQFNSPQVYISNCQTSYKEVTKRCCRGCRASQKAKSCHHLSKECHPSFGKKKKIKIFYKMIYYTMLLEF